ncbi:GH3 auxin-responsive promoter family protein [Psychroserpens sp.]|uniref:GH3 auxin-responsive promoter family protein n=1 Tax=Psychroserpens sp. TaxID=2020870 RepID=UPI001B1655DE|nr:GH3 auxin-responsive promoter family protein [Psychroserpens sp.]MBO6607880.1 GH3 auxin-responsive promoter family protein [Psychroserpens sp.]MBO6654993.1 GH3 auxin-responsive promoter family protein [Psychroserpens sp.]MBO6682933.1 GH3 auxin-responsive promoter family protein [Psychroserpens sp.]MBO6751238.1 GH3 auxin-responsive promoter family protein [Psychroserpens sp.]MBO6916421.1 GH3 auxin-responsive promoter family protein [Psychroserpens sp.]
MPIPLVNSIASWFLKKRFHQIELFLKYPNEVQNELLFDLLTTAKDTEIGKRYDFASIDSYKTFSERIPVTTYEDCQDMIERSRQGESNIFWPNPIKWYAKSSGTTNAKSKFIPVSTESLEDCHYAASKDLLCMYLNNNEDSQLFTGKSLRLGGSKELYKENGTVFGDLSAILIDNMPFWAEFSSTPSSKVSLMSDWEVKMAAIVEETRNENVTSLAGVPSWMLVLLNTILETTGKQHLFELWPNLEVYFHGGVSFVPYVDQYKAILPRDNFKYYEIYNASEGFFAIQDLNNSSELLLMLDYGIFYEFIPMDTYGTLQQKVIPLSDVEIGKNYAVVITTNAGLWRYKIGDTVRFTSTNPYRIKVSGRTKHHINAFGEELIIENAEDALRSVCSQTQSEIVDYTAAPIFMSGKSKGSHEWLIEFKTPPSDLQQFNELLDQKLKSLNSDYEAKRLNNMTLNMPTLHIARERLFYDWLKKHDKLGGQHKIPRLSNSREYIDELLQLNRY